VIVPVVALPPVTPFTCHVTAVFADPVTIAVNCCVLKTSTLAGLGDTVTVTAGGVAVTVTVADPILAAFACEVAVTVTVAGFGTLAGAVYDPAPEIVPFAAPPTTAHVTAVFDVPVTVAVN